MHEVIYSILLFTVVRKWHEEAPEAHVFAEDILNILLSIILLLGSFFIIFESVKRVSVLQFLIFNRSFVLPQQIYLES